MSPFIRIKKVNSTQGCIEDRIIEVIVKEEISPRMLIDIKYAVGPYDSSALIIWAEDREWRGPKSEPVEEEIQPEPPKPTEEEILRGKVCEMKEKGWTVSEISKRLGIPPGAVINMCKDETDEQYKAYMENFALPVGASILGVDLASGPDMTGNYTPTKEVMKRQVRGLRAAGHSIDEIAGMTPVTVAQIVKWLDGEEEDLADAKENPDDEV